MTEEKKVFVRGRVSEAVRVQFKAKCALESRTMDSVMEALIVKWLKDEVSIEEQPLRQQEEK